jgi:hypothetical protein
MTILFAAQTIRSCEPPAPACHRQQQRLHEVVAEADEVSEAEAPLVVTIYSEPDNAFALTGGTVLDVPLRAGSDAWTAEVPWRVLELEAGGTSEVVLDTKLCDACGCWTFPNPPTVAVVEEDELSGDLALTLDALGPDVLPSDGATEGEITIASTDASADGADVVVSVTGAEFVTDDGGGTAATVRMLGDGAGASARVWIRSATPGAAVVLASSGDASGHLVVDVVAPPTIGVSATTMIGDGAVGGQAASPGGALGWCTWSSSDPGLAVTFVPAISGSGQSFVGDVEPDAASIDFTITTTGITAPASASLSCTDVWGRSTPTVAMTAVPPV